MSSWNRDREFKRPEGSKLERMGKTVSNTIEGRIGKRLRSCGKTRQRVNKNPWVDKSEKKKILRLDLNLWRLMETEALRVSWWQLQIQKMRKAPTTLENPQLCSWPSGGNLPAPQGLPSSRIKKRCAGITARGATLLAYRGPTA